MPLSWAKSLGVFGATDKANRADSCCGTIDDWRRSAFR